MATPQTQPATMPQNSAKNEQTSTAPEDLHSLVKKATAATPTESSLGSSDHGSGGEDQLENKLETSGIPLSAKSRNGVPSDATNKDDNHRGEAAHEDTPSPEKADASVSSKKIPKQFQYDPQVEHTIHATINQANKTCKTYGKHRPEEGEILRLQKTVAQLSQLLAAKGEVSFTTTFTNIADALAGCQHAKPCSCISQWSR
jgi:hypothetical protein